MTTIAYKDGIIAYDSRATMGDTIISNKYDKKYSRDGVHFFTCGRKMDAIPLANAYIDGDLSYCDSNALVWDSNKQLLCMIGYEDDESLFIDPYNLDDTYAIGSGFRHALTAMDMGASAKEAIKMASIRDTGTGGKIRVFKIK